MAIHFPEILTLRSESKVTWSERDTILYALGIGLGADPVDRCELPFVYGPSLVAAPTMASALANVGAILRRSGAEYTKVMHGEQAVVLDRPLPVAGELFAHARVAAVYDKGVGKGAVLVFETTLSDRNGEPVVTLESTVVARGDGGCGGSGEQLAPHPIPARPPDLSLEFTTRPDQALLYRLSGDYNPLHADPETAAAAGFERPILHGLCTYGITGRAVLQGFLAYDPTRLYSHAARFSASVFPGESILVDLWRDGLVISFEARVPKRNVTVIRNGKAVLRN